MSPLLPSLDEMRTRDPDATCHRCGRRGTIAVMASSLSPDAARYCRGCWPAAYVEAKAQIAGARQQATPAVASMAVDNAGTVVTTWQGSALVARWHWTVTLATWLGQRRAGNRSARQAAV